MFWGNHFDDDHPIITTGWAYLPKILSNAARLKVSTFIPLIMSNIKPLVTYEDNTHEYEDAVLLDRAYELERVLFTRDDDLLVEATLT